MLDRNIDKVERIIELTSNSGKKEQFRVGDIVDINYRKPFDPRGVGYNEDAGLTGRIADIKDAVIYVDAGTLFHSNIVPIMLVEKKRMYINFINDDVVQAHKAISTPLPVVMEYTGNTIYQAIFYVKQAEQSKITEHLKNVEITRWNDSAIDIVAKGGSKVTGIEKYLYIKGYTKEESAAFGDGENDMEMLKYVGKGIAMGNASDFVKSVADYVTSDIDNDGVEKGLNKLGLF